MSKYDELLDQLKDVRERQSTTKGLMNKMIDSVRESEEYKSFQTMNETENELIENIEKELRDLALSEFQASGNKKPHEKVSIKIFKVFKVIDAEKVADWCRRFYVGALKPDMKMVEGYVKDNSAFDGVELTEEARAQIATKI